MFKKSITKRLFIQIILVVISFSVLLLISNTLLLKPLYYNSIKNNMIDSLESIQKLDFEESNEEWVSAIEKNNSNLAFETVVLKNGELIYSSTNRKELRPMSQENDIKYNQDPLPGRDFFMPTMGIKNWNEIESNIYIAEMVDNVGQNQFMIFYTQIEDVRVYLFQAVEPINKSVIQANVLLLICTIIFLIIVFFVSLSISKRFTKPIKQINNQVREITSLNFVNKLNVNTGDELQELGNDINLLSDKLEKSLKSLREKNEQLEKDILMERKFLSNASHELRTPLSLIKGYADEIKAGYIKSSEEQKTYIDIISEEATKMNRLLKEILDLSRLESGRMKLDCEDIKISCIVNQFIEKYDGFITKNKIKVNIDIPRYMIGYFDPLRFEQILANYISNGAKYSNSEKRIRIFAKEIFDKIRICVYNSGERLDEETSKHVWDGFYKADNARTRKEESYGLGLSVVKAIQTVSGNGYGAYNVKDGVVFWFEVDKAEEA